MKAHICLVGCGFLGSLFAEECAKRWFALGDELQFTLIDDDRVDERNPANHLYTVEEIGVLKVVALSDHLMGYNQTPTWLEQRVGPDNAPAALTEADLLVDAVDNLPTRQWLWTLGIKGQPVLHLGVSQLGTGSVEWTLRDYDTFGLSPLALARYTEEQQKALTTTRKLPPCDLVSFRGLGLNVALAGAKAAGIAFDIDPERVIQPHVASVLTSWNATNTGHELREAWNVPQ